MRYHYQNSSDFPSCGRYLVKSNIFRVAEGFKIVPFEVLGMTLKFAFLYFYVGFVNAKLDYQEALTRFWILREVFFGK